MPKGEKKPRRDDTDFTQYKEGGKVNAAGNYTKPRTSKDCVSSQSGGNSRHRRRSMVGKESSVGSQEIQGCWRGIQRLKAPQTSLKNWGDQKWRTKSGKRSSDTGERYLPEAAIKVLALLSTLQQRVQNVLGKKPGSSS
jgi:hypothetical protein